MNEMCDRDVDRTINERVTSRNDVARRLDHRCALAAYRRLVQYRLAGDDDAICGDDFASSNPDDVPDMNQPDVSLLLRGSES